MAKASKQTSWERLAIKHILADGIQFKTTKWIQAHRNRAPVLILADSRLENWPVHDKLCVLEYRKGWSIRRWIQAVKTGEILINSYTVILYLESTRNWDAVPPIKNCLHALCKAIKNHAPDPRVFVVNPLPLVSTSPITTPMVNSNFTLQQATCSICRAIGRVFELSMYEHFVSSRSGKIIKPVSKYFTESGGLSSFGCLVFRECLLREAGLKSYWFSERDSAK